jgi:hypothetical protein
VYLAPTADRNSGGRLALFAQLATLFLTGSMLWFFRIAPRLVQQSPVRLVLHALGFALLAWTWSSIIAFGLFLSMPPPARGRAAGRALRTAAVAVWFAPATILLSELSPGALAAALILVVAATRLVYSEIDPPLLVRHLWPSLAASLALQAGAASAVLRFPLLAAAWFVMGIALLTALSLLSGAAGPGRPPTLPRSIVGVLSTILLAAALTVGASRGFLRGSTGGPGGPSKTPDVPEADGQDLPGSFPGVVLRPEIAPFVTLVDPLPYLHRPAPGRAPARAFSIPFGGEYWLYRSPYDRPPRNSYFRRGSPARLSFSTPDRYPLRMVARQRLLQAIDMDCCGRLRIDILNADRYPWTISLEAVLVDEDSPGAPAQTLGTVRLSSVPDRGADPTPPVPETLDFTFPRSGPLKAFNLIEVIFRRDNIRSDKSSRVSIERFLLVPREGGL